MAEEISNPSSSRTLPSQDASEPAKSSSTGFTGPSFSYLSSVNNPHRSSQQSTVTPVMPSESSGTMGPAASGISMSSPPSFSYNFSDSNSDVLGSHPSSISTNGRADGIQEAGAANHAPTFMHPTSNVVQLNPNPSASHFIPYNFNNTTNLMPPAPTFQVPKSIPHSPVTPGPPGIVTSILSPSNSTLHAINSVPPNPISQHHAGTVYPFPSPQATLPGSWLQTQQISGFARPPFAPFIAGAGTSGPYPIPTRGVPPFSASANDIKPPGVPAQASAVGATGEHLTLNSAQAELPPGTDDNRKHIGSSEPKIVDSSKELDAWTAHRTETGIVYYYNALTGQSTYERPPSFKGESDRAAVQPTPVSWERVPGTDWTVVTTNDGKKYYYNNVTRLSSWQIPSEVTELRKKQEADALKAQSVTVPTTNLESEKGSDPVVLSTPAASTGGRDAASVRSLNVSGSSSTALDLIKKKLHDSGTSDSNSQSPALSSAEVVELNGSKPMEVSAKSPPNETSKEKQKDKNGDNDMSNSSSDSEEEGGVPTKEASILQFKEMLKERGVAPFSKWEKELPKIVFDPRFKAIPSHDARRAIFDHFVRTRAVEERKEKRVAHKAALDHFKQLLEEAKEDIDEKTDYQTFKRKWGEDPRFVALDRKERESLLKERIRAAQERVQAQHATAISNFKAMLQDKDIDCTSRWSKVKDVLKGDPRYKSIRHEEREKIFNEYVAELKAAEAAAARKDSAKQDEEVRGMLSKDYLVSYEKKKIEIDDEEKLKERERALRKRKERDEQEVERVRQKAHRKVAVESYQALLVETIKDPQASWTDSKPKLEKDPQGRAANPHLDKSDLEKLFRDHVKSLHERCVLEYKSLLKEVITAEAANHESEDAKTVVNSWSTAKQLLKSDSRYNKMPRKEREALWRRHCEDIERKLKKQHDDDDDDVDQQAAATDGKRQKLY